MTPAPCLSTARLTLRAPAPEDLGAYLAYYAATDVRVGKYRGGRTVAEIEAILAEDIAHWSAKGFGMWLMRGHSDPTVIGGAGLAHPDDWPSHELTWWLMPEDQGNGYATEASRAVIEWAYDHLGWPVVETHMRDENTPARKLAARLGGRVVRRDTFPDGVQRDVFALPREAGA